MVSLMGPILFGIHRFSYYYKINEQTSKSKGLCSFGNCSWYIFGAMVNQGSISYLCFVFIIVIIIIAVQDTNTQGCLQHTLLSILDFCHPFNSCHLSPFIHHLRHLLNSHPILFYSNISKVHPSVTFLSFFWNFCFGYFHLVHFLNGATTSVVTNVPKCPT